MEEMYKLQIKNVILIIAATMIFLNLTIYLPFVNLFPFPAYLIDLTIFTIVIIYYFKNSISFPIQNIILIWLIYYFSLNTSYFIISPTGEEEFTYLKIFFFSLFMFISFIFLFNLDDDNLTTTRKTSLILGLIATIMLGIDYFEPGYFYFGKELENYVVGRASATYLNANISGGAMIVFLILSIDMIPKKLRFLFILIFFLGVFFTMSRSNIMIMFLVLTIMFFQKKLYGSHLLVIFGTIILFFTWLSNGGLDLLENKYNLEITENMQNRVDFFIENSSSNVGDIDQRREVLFSALNMFADNPIFGQGYAATSLWEHSVSPHNTLAMHWAEFGIFGIILIPLMFLFSTYHIFKYGNGDQKNLAVLIMVYFTFSSFFSHDMLYQPLQVAPIIILSVIGYKAKRKFIRQLNDY